MKNTEIKAISKVFKERKESVIIRTSNIVVTEKQLVVNRKPIKKISTFNFEIFKKGKKI